MGLRKGQTNNPNGRPQGTPNKVTSETKDWILDLIESNREQIKADIMQMEPCDRVRTILALLNYIVPKQKAVNLETTNTAIPIILIDDGMD